MYIHILCFPFFFYLLFPYQSTTPFLLSLFTHSSLTHSLPHSLTLSLSLTHYLSPSLTHLLRTGNSGSLTHSLTPSLLPSLPHSFPYSITHSHSLTPPPTYPRTHPLTNSLLPSLPLSLPPVALQKDNQVLRKRLMHDPTSVYTISRLTWQWRDQQFQGTIFQEHGARGKAQLLNMNCHY